MHFIHSFIHSFIALGPSRPGTTPLKVSPSTPARHVLRTAQTQGAQRGEEASQGHTAGRWQSRGSNLITSPILLLDPGKLYLGSLHGDRSYELALPGFPPCLQSILSAAIQLANVPCPSLAPREPWGGR